MRLDQNCAIRKYLLKCFQNGYHDNAQIFLTILYTCCSLRFSDFFQESLSSWSAFRWTLLQTTWYGGPGVRKGPCAAVSIQEAWACLALIPPSRRQWPRVVQIVWEPIPKNRNGCGETRKEGRGKLRECEACFLLCKPPLVSVCWECTLGNPPSGEEGSDIQVQNPVSRWMRVALGRSTAVGGRMPTPMEPCKSLGPATPYLILAKGILQM